jgi:BMFP domain-containing protein YqiC
VDIAVEGGAQDMPGAYFGLKGKIDLAGEQGVYSFNLKGDEIPVSIIETMLGADSPLDIKGGSTVFNIGLDMEGDYISSYFLVMIKNILLAARPEGLKEVDESLVRILDDSVKNINRISFKGKASGDLKNLQISVSSDIDKILNKVFAKAVENARAEAERRIRKELDREIGKRAPEIKKLLTDDSGQLASLDSLAGSVRKQLEKRVQKEIDKQKKKVEKSLQKKLGEELNKALKNFKLPF